MAGEGESGFSNRVVCFSGVVFVTVFLVFSLLILNVWRPAGYGLFYVGILVNPGRRRQRRRFFDAAGQVGKGIQYCQPPGVGRLICLAVRSVMGVQRLIQGNGAFVGQTLNGAGQRIAAKQQVRLTGQFAGLGCSDQLALVIQNINLAACGQVQT